MSPNYDIDGKTVKNNKINSNNVPGPGAYDPTDIEETHSPKYTISKTGAKKKKRVQSAKTPAVGDYNLRNDKDLNECGFHFDKEKRNNLNLNKTALNYPAPNKYTIDYNNLSSHGPKWTFSKTERFKRKKPKSAFFRRLNVPGPGSYKTETFMGKEGPHYTFTKTKYNHSDAADEGMFKKTVNYPGPGSYGPKIIYQADTPVYTMSKLKRKEIGSDKYLLSCPGPDHYNPDKYVCSTMKKFPVWTMSKANKDENEKVKGSKKVRVQTPGPGHYHSKYGNIPNGPQFSMAKKLTKKKKDERPGPGNYNIQYLHLPSEPKYTFGKEKRKDEKIAQNTKDNFPGPSNYNIKDTKFNEVGYFTKDKRYKESKFITPGPGAYKIPTAFDYLADYERQKGAFNPIFKYV